MKLYDVMLGGRFHSRSFSKSRSSKSESVKTRSVSDWKYRVIGPILILDFGSDVGRLRVRSTLRRSYVCKRSEFYLYSHNKTHMSDYGNGTYGNKSSIVHICLFAGMLCDVRTSKIATSRNKQPNKRTRGSAENGPTLMENVAAK
jgi:hypothetical protein